MSLLILPAARATNTQIVTLKFLGRGSEVQIVTLKFLRQGCDSNLECARRARNLNVTIWSSSPGQLNRNAAISKSFRNVSYRKHTVLPACETGHIEGATLLPALETGHIEGATLLSVLGTGRIEGTT